MAESLEEAHRDFEAKLKAYLAALNAYHAVQAEAMKNSNDEINAAYMKAYEHQERAGQTYHAAIRELHKFMGRR